MAFTKKKNIQCFGLLERGGRVVYGLDFGFDTVNNPERHPILQRRIIGNSQKFIDNGISKVEWLEPNGSIHGFYWVFILLVGDRGVKHGFQ